MRTITSSGTLTDAIFPGSTFDVILTIQIFDLGLKQGNLAEVADILRKDGQEIPNGRYDLRDAASGEFFHLRKRTSGWEADVLLTAANHIVEEQ